jgi:hypothetical protein
MHRDFVKCYLEDLQNRVQLGQPSLARGGGVLQGQKKTPFLQT